MQRSLDPAALAALIEEKYPELGERLTSSVELSATPDAYHDKGRFKLPEQPKRGNSQAWPYPVVANRRLYVHDLGTIWCYDLKN